jgi:hypothetical protein
VLSQLRQLGFDVELDESPATFPVRAVGGNFDVAVQFANRPIFEPGTNINFRFGPAPPVGNNVTHTGEGDPLWTKYYNAALQNIGPGSCRYFELVEQINQKNHYAVPLAAPYFDVFSRKSALASVPNWTPTGASMQWYWVAMR